MAIQKKPNNKTTTNQTKTTKQTKNLNNNNNNKTKLKKEAESLNIRWGKLIFWALLHIQIPVLPQKVFEVFIVLEITIVSSMWVKEYWSPKAKVDPQLA